MRYIYSLRCPDHPDDRHLHQPVNEGNKYHEVVETSLPVFHLFALPVRDPVDHPEEIDNPSDNKEENEAELELLNAIRSES